MEAVCTAFNSANPVGAEIWGAPGDVRGRFELMKVVAPGAYVMSGHTMVVQVDSGHGCIALTHVRVRIDGRLEPIAGAR